MRLIIDIPENVYLRMKALYEIGMGSEAVGVILNGTPIPDNATNGDVIKAVFPNTSLHIDERSHTVWVGYEEMSFRIDWWNAPYQKERRC